MDYDTKDTTSIHQGAWEPPAKVRGHEGKHPRHSQAEYVPIVISRSRSSSSCVSDNLEAPELVAAGRYLEFSVARDPIDRFVAVVNLFHQVCCKRRFNIIADISPGI